MGRLPIALRWVTTVQGSPPAISYEHDFTAGIEADWGEARDELCVERSSSRWACEHDLQATRNGHRQLDQVTTTSQCQPLISLQQQLHSKSTTATAQTQLYCLWVFLDSEWYLQSRTWETRSASPGRKWPLWRVWLRRLSIWRGSSTLVTSFPCWISTISR